MERVRWTDERLDDRMDAIDRNFELIRDELRDLRSDFNRFQDRMIQIGFGMVAVLAAQLVAAIVALS